MRAFPRPVTAVLAAVLAVAALTACGSDPKPPPRAAETSAVPTTAPPSTTPPPTVSATPTVAPTTAAPVTTQPPATTRPPTAGTTPPGGGGIKTNRRCETPPAASRGGHGRAITPSAPLDLLITGDSIQESSGPQLAAYANAKRHVVAACTVPKYSTGLVRDDFFDWPAYARQLAAERDPEAVTFMIGGNDAQNMSVGGRILQAGSAEWAAEYQKRAAAVMRGFAREDRRMYWIGMPIARSDRHTQVYRVVNDAVKKAAAGVPGVEFVDIWAMFAPNGRYQDSFANEHGTVERMRSSDGIHLSTAGAAYLARHLLEVLNEDWHLTG